MLKSLVVHYKNKYPTARVESGENHLAVISKDGELLVSVKRGGGGVVFDAQKDDGAKYPHDMSPIPRNTRVYKLTVHHTIEKDEEAAERLPTAKMLEEELGFVPSIEQCKTELKIEVDAFGNVLLPLKSA
jgi:hypothetical protein